MVVNALRRVSVIFLVDLPSYQRQSEISISDSLVILGPTNDIKLNDKKLFIRFFSFLFPY